MVASGIPSILEDRQHKVSIPFIAGQWSLPGAVSGRVCVRNVSIPFIAGQWSLHLQTPVPLVAGFMFQSPSLRGSGRFFGRLYPDIGCVGVSIPFIAGQWSLLTRRPVPNSGYLSFQSPSLRGSGRFSGSGSLVRLLVSCFNPLHCGAVVASVAIV